VGLDEPDGLYTPTVGPWSEEKYLLLRTYSHMFATGMKNKWRCRVYVDLFTGSGKAVVEGTTRARGTSALIALSLRDGFDRYVFCEEDRRSIEALRRRVSESFAGADVRYVQGDCNERVDEILRELPSVHDRGAIALCFVDPFGLSDLKFETLRRIARGRSVDFLVLIPSGMDANRNQARLRTRENRILDEFLGSDEWRSRWSTLARAPVPPSFGGFVVDEFGRSMQAMGYLRVGPQDAVLVDNQNRPLYHLAVYSRNPRGGEFWKKAKRSASKQDPLPGMLN
jgi:three-Cys-motif partner protein